MTDLRRVMHETLRDYGHDIILQRRRPDELTGPQPHSHFYDAFERFTVRRVAPGSMAMSHMEEEMPEGLVTTVDMVYYFLWREESPHSPSKGDRIYEGEPRETYLVDYVHAMRGVHGRVEFFVVGSTRETPN